MLLGSSRRRWARALGAGLAYSVVAALALPVLSAGPASADTPPPTVPATVSADALPTVQVDGVVWAQVVVGNTVYATGRFSNARPAGAAAGTNLTPRSNILAYDLTTGNLITSWAPSLNAQGLAITAAPDGSRVYVAGEFTSVNGTTHNRIVALDTATGAVVTAFKVSTDYRVRALTAVGGTVYAGGNFASANNQARSRLAAFRATDGSLLPWAPAADAEVYAMVAPTATSELVVGGRMSTLNGEANRGMGALDLTTGATLPWAANQVIQNYGANSAIYSLSSDGQVVYGTAYDYYGPSDFENAFAADPAGGALRWVNGCYGDTYSNASLNGVLYTTGHAHNCSAIGGHPDTNPRTFQRAQAFDASGGNTNRGGPFDGRPAATILPWLPTLTPGTYTGQTQAAWSVAGNSSYVVLGGEFPKVNSTAQQGLVRFAVRSAAPNKEGPQTTSSELQPALVSLYPGTVRATWKAAWDRDDHDLKYELLRGSTTSSATVVATATAGSAWWSRPALVLNDPNAPAGTSQTYRIRVTDPSGNKVVSPATTVAVPAASGQTSTYRDAVRADGAQDYWRLDEPSGTGSYDWVGAEDLVVDPSAVRGRDGATGDGDTAIGFSGTATVPAVTPTPRPGPDTFTAEAWIRTTTTSGGKIIGYGDSATGGSSNYDRQVYMGNDGRLAFGVYSGGARTLTSAKAYNDGQWHHVVASLSSAGTVLYVDGARVGRDISVTSGQPFSGYWRIGGDSLGGWPNQPSSSSFAGDVDDVAVYPTALSQQTVQAHYSASGRTLAVPTRPADPYGAAVWDSAPDSFWRLEDTSGTAVADSTANGTHADLVGGPTLGAAGIQGSHGVSLDGVDDTLVSSSPVSNPSRYSLEMWFKTTTTRGGKLVGLGDARSGRSSSYDRQVYMYDDGRLSFDTWFNGGNRADSTTSYNDGAWHHLVATQGSAGMVLYVDGAAVATNPQTGAQDYTGYWRVGGDNTWGGASSDWLTGSVDEIATYSSVLDAATVADHFTKGGGTLPDRAPTASFTSAVKDLGASFDASASADADGSIASYAWDFGDGAKGAGATASHSYRAAGTYQVTLTVTDDKGAKGTVTRSVTVTAPVPPAATALVKDSFGRTVSGGLGTADTGGAWTTSGAAANFSVAGGAGLVKVATAGSTSAAYLNEVSSADTDLRATASLDKPATGGGTYISLIGRRVAGNDYRVKTKVAADGTVSLTLEKVVSGVETSFKALAVPGLRYATGQQLALRLQVVGTAPTTLNAKLWAVGSTEPTSWTATATDAATGLQSPGGLGVLVYSSGSSTNAPVTLSVRDLSATTSGAAPPAAADQAPTASFASAVKDLGATFDASASTDADGSVAAWAWDFGDGARSTGVTASHAYSSGGTYHVTLTVTDDRGATGAVTQDVTVSAPPSTQGAA